MGIEQQGAVARGKESELHESLREEIGQILHEPSTPPEARPWLREVIARLQTQIPRQIVWEYDIDLDDLRTHIRGENRSQRMWAIGRVLKYARWEDIRRLLSVEDIEEALPHIDLPEKKRKTLERAIEVWRHGQ